MLEAQPLKTRLNLNDEEFISNKKSMLGKLNEIDELLDEAEAGELRADRVGARVPGQTLQGQIGGGARPGGGAARGAGRG